MSIKVFKRVEYKYLIDENQYNDLLDEIRLHLKSDKHGMTTIQSLYFDTDNRLLIRRSIEKPKYKEKIRLRSYGLANEEKKVFLELKKKANGIVFKRRISTKERDAFNFILSGKLPDSSQITKEIDYFIKMYQSLEPSILVLYDRTAFVDPNSNLRITFDRNVRYRTERLNLHSDLDGELILKDGKILMEVKSDFALPLWLVKKLSQNLIYKQSFSKYGEAYCMELIKKKNKEEIKVG